VGGLHTSPLSCEKGGREGREEWSNENEVGEGRKRRRMNGNEKGRKQGREREREMAGL